jgi:hypothetical protein
MRTRKGSSNANALAVGGLVLFVTLPLLWTLTPVLMAFAIPSSEFPPRQLVATAIALAMLVGAAAYLRAPSLLWQVPLQTLALACLIVGVSLPILNWHSVSATTAAICVGYVAAGAALGWLMRKSQRRFLR